MKKRRYLCLIILFFCLAGAGCTLVIKGTSVEDASNAKKRLEKKIEETDQKIAELEKEKGNIVNYIKKLDIQMEDLDTQIKETNEEIGAVNKELKKTKKELKEAKKEEKKQYDSMKKRIKYMYENGSTDYVSMLLESESIADFLNRAEYIAKISAYDNNLLKEHKALKKKIAKKEKSLEIKAEELSVLQEELTYEQSKVNQLVENKTTELKKYNANIETASGEVKKYQEEMEKQEALIEQLLEQERRRIEEEERRKEEERKKEEEQRKEEERRKEAERQKQEEANENQGQSNGGKDSGKENTPSDDQTDSGSDNNQNQTETDYQGSSADFRWPLNVSGTITSYFGAREQPTSGASTYHKGIDISVPSGTSIVAAAAGRVVTAAYSSSAGNYVMLYHGNSIYTVYMHCSSLNVSVNQEVQKGDVIASVGSTGISTGAHLHFGISVNGAYVNPLNYVSQ